jgi:hypothetical protein
MAILSKGHTFNNGDQVTSTKLNNLVDAATFAAGAVDNATITLHASGYVQVGTIQTGNIAAGSVTTAKLADSTSSIDGVTTAKLATGAVTTVKIADANVTAVKLATDAVETAKIKDANVTAAKLSGAQTGNAPIFGVRAAGEFLFETSSRTLGAAPLNVASVTRTDANTTAVTFTTALPNDDYFVVCNYNENGSAYSTLPQVHTRLTTGFSIDHRDEGTGRSLNFIVVG